MRRTFLGLATLALAGVACAQTNLYLEKTVNLNPTGAGALDVFGGTSGNDGGFNPSAIATDGTNAWVAGWNATNAPARTAIVRILNAFGASPTAQVMPNSIFTSTPTTRGYTGLEIASNGFLVATYDPGVSDPNGLRAFGAFDGAVKWAVAQRGSGHVANDPGFAATDSGIATVQFSSGRRWLYNPADGTNLYSTNGLIFLPTGASSLMRSITFNPTNGNVFARAANDVFAADRTAGNGSTNVRYLVNVTDAPFVAGHNIEFTTLNGTDHLIYNDRPVTASTQPFADVVKSVDPVTGVAQPLAFKNPDGSAATLPVGNGYYDFAFANGKLVVLDFLNRNIYVFSTTPPSTRVNPTAVTVVLGSQLGGSLASLITSDNNRFLIINDENDAEGNVEITFQAPSGTFSTINATAEVIAVRDDLTTFIRMFNYVTSQWDDQDFHVSTLVDNVRTFSITTGAANYFSGTNELKMQIQWIPSADLDSGDGWSEGIDQAVLDIN